MSRAGEENDAEVIFPDQSVEVDIDEAHAGVGTPMSEQAALDVLGFQRLAQQRLVAQVDHPGREERAGMPISIDALQLLGFARAARHRGAGRTIGADRSSIRLDGVHGFLRALCAPTIVILPILGIDLRHREDQYPIECDGLSQDRDPRRRYQRKRGCSYWFIAVRDCDLFPRSAMKAFGVAGAFMVFFTHSSAADHP
jgi:hypothetical protein